MDISLLLLTSLVYLCIFLCCKSVLVITKWSIMQKSGIFLPLLFLIVSPFRSNTSLYSSSLMPTLLLNSHLQTLFRSLLLPPLLVLPKIYCYHLYFGPYSAIIVFCFLPSSLLVIFFLIMLSIYQWQPLFCRFLYHYHNIMTIVHLNNSLCLFLCFRNYKYMYQTSFLVPVMLFMYIPSTIFPCYTFFILTFSYLSNI